MVSKSIYQIARVAKGYTQEKAAEFLNISVDSLKAYESGRTIPNDDIVFNMADIYDAHHLKPQHMRNSSILGRTVIPEFKTGENVSTAILNLFKEHGDINQFKDKLIEIGADGVIGENEQETMKQVVKECQDLISALMTLIYTNGE